MSGKLWAIWFSPTGGTCTYVRAIAEGAGGPVTEVELTRPEQRGRPRRFSGEDLVILGVPVYYGRVPGVPDLLEGLVGADTPVVLAAVYGNRAVEDALVELSDLCAARGLRTVAAGSFVAPHSYSVEIAGDRPNQADLAAARELGRRVRAKLEAGERGAPELPGNRPYRSFQPAPFWPEGDDSCVRCGACRQACPTGAVDAAAPRVTDSGRCLRCMACTRVCPTGSRRVHVPAFASKVEQMKAALSQPHQPELYL